jgi:small-conductance mechanosensitive channel
MEHNDECHRSDCAAYAEVKHMLGVIETRQQAFMREQKRLDNMLERHFVDDEREFAQLNNRLREIERRLSYATGGIMVFVAVGTLFWNSIIAYFTGGS